MTMDIQLAANTWQDARKRTAAAFANDYLAIAKHAQREAGEDEEVPSKAVDLVRGPGTSW